MDGFLRQSTASQTRWIGPFLDDTDFKTAETALSIANTDIKVSKNGGASASKNSGGGTHDVNGLYAVTWDATDTATVGQLFYSVKVAGALQVFGTYTVLEEEVYDDLMAASAVGYLKPQTAGRDLLVDATGNADARLADGVSHGGTLGSGTATLALSRLSVVSQSANTNAVTATGNGTGHGMALTSGSGATGNGLTLLSASANGHGLKSTGTGTGDGAELTAGASGADLDADIAGTITTVTGNVNGNVGGNVTGSVGSVVGAVGSVTGAVGSVTGNVGGNVTGSVGSVAAGGIAAASFAAGAIDASAIAANAIGASEIADGAIDAATFAAGAINAAAIAADAITAAKIATGAIDADALAADAVDEILDDTIGDGTLTVRQALRICVAALAGKLSGAAGTTVTIRNAADSADVIVATVDANGNRTATTITP